MREESLLIPSVDSLTGFFPEVPHVVGGDDGLDVGSDAAAARIQVELVVNELHVDTVVHKIA